jgi:diketogulonate reductase-like aldo/keto reductase
MDLTTEMELTETTIMRAIPVSGERLPVIGLGTWQTFDVHETNVAALEPVLSTFLKSGARLIDTSPMYGKAEAVVGELVAKAAPHPFLATKVWTRGRIEGIAQMERSIRLLRSEQLDLIQVHNLLEWQTHLSTLRRWKEEGRIRYLGITHYQTMAFPQLEAIMQRESLDFVQLPMSPEVPEAAERLLPLAESRGIAVIINRPFEEGALLRRLRGKPVPDWAAGYDCETWAELVLKWIVSHEAVTCVIPATSSVQHMADNLRAGRGRLWNEAERRAVRERLLKA